VFKEFLILPENRLKLAFRAELYNVTNTPRFAFPDRNLQNLTFGRITGTYNPQNFVGASQADDTSRVMPLAFASRDLKEAPDARPVQTRPFPWAGFFLN
jgi:hypothetical protein